MAFYYEAITGLMKPNQAITCIYYQDITDLFVIIDKDSTNSMTYNEKTVF